MRLAEVDAILDLIGVHGRMPKSGKITAPCPFAHLTHAKGEDKNPSFAVIHTRHGGWAYSCRACAEHGGLLNLIWRMSKGKDRVKAIGLYYEAVDLEHKAETHRTRLDYVPFADAPAVRKDAPKADREYASAVNRERAEQLALVGDSQAGPQEIDEAILASMRPGPVDYMVERGFDADVQEAFDVRDDFRQHRAAFPIRDWNGRLLGVTRRLYWKHDWCFSCDASISDGAGGIEHRCRSCGKLYVKYLHTKGMNRNEFLYGEWKFQPSSVVLLAEGVTDVMRLWALGLRPPLAAPMAILGAYPGETQIRRLVAKIGSAPVIIVRDNDPPTAQHPNGAGAEMYPEVVRLAPGSRVYEAITPAKDPGSLTDEQGAALVQWVRGVASGSVNPGSYEVAPR